MRYELSDYEWTAIKPMLDKPRGVRRVNDRRVLNGIFWDASRPDRTNSQPTIWRSSNSHQSEFGCALMSPRPGWSPRTRRRWLINQEYLSTSTS